MIRVEQVVDALNDYINGSRSRELTDEVLYSYLNNTEEYRADSSKELYTKLVRSIFDRQEIPTPYYLFSALFKLTLVPEVFYELCSMAESDETISKETRYFLYYQLSSYPFFYPAVNTSEGRQGLDRLYEKVYRQFRQEVEDLCIKSVKNERNTELIIVLVPQVLGLNHGPTKTLFDRCYTFATRLKKKVYIINTADLLTTYGGTDFFDIKEANYIPELGKDGYLEFRGIHFAYYQCQEEMPQVSVIRGIMQTIIEEKPWMIIAIGGSNITADLCASIVPSLTVSVGFSELVPAHTTFQTSNHPVNDADRFWLRKHGLTESHLIESTFTFDFKPQVSKLSRKELGLEEGVTYCLVVGGRLDIEIDETFMKLIKELALEGIGTVFMGYFNNYKNYVPDDNLYSRYIKYIGFQEDALAVCECCNIYLNPRRSGGGTSAAEAMYKGLPALSFAYGDVGVTVHEEFQVSSYEEMYSKVLRLRDDEAYCCKMRNLAIERARKLTDTDGEFSRIIGEMESREEFF